MGSISVIKMVYRNQNYMTNRLIKQETDKNQKTTTNDIKNYTFNSYGDAEGNTFWGTGEVKTTGVMNRGLTEVEVISNSTDESFIGQKFFVNSSANADNTTIYPLYTNLNKEKSGIYVKIGEAEEEVEEVFTPVTYSFTSYGDKDGETEWGKGTVETTGVESNGYTQVQVKTNDTDQDFIGEKFYITSDAKTDNTTIYELYNDAGTTHAGIYVKISKE